MIFNETLANKNAISAKNPHTLAELAWHDSIDVRVHVAGNAHASAKTLGVLADKSQNCAVRYSAAQNPSMPPNLLAILSIDSDPLIREGVAMNRNASAGLLAIMAKDKEYSVRRRVAQNPNTPPETLTRLSRDRSIAVREGVASNGSTAAVTLAWMRTEKASAVRRALATNPNNPITNTAEVIKKLVGGGAAEWNASFDGKPAESPADTKATTYRETAESILGKINDLILDAASPKALLAAVNDAKEKLTHIADIADKSHSIKPKGRKI